MKTLYFLINTQNEATKLLNYFKSKLINKQIHIFLEKYDSDLLYGFYSPSKYCIKVEYFNNGGVEIWHCTLSPEYKITDLLLFIRKQKLKRILQ